MIALTAVQSSNVDAFGYDESQHVLAVKFKSAERPHLYRDVDPETFAAVQSAYDAGESVGSVISRRVRNCFDCEAPDGTVTPAKTRAASHPAA